MRDTEQETEFVDAFITPERRDRYKQMLANSKRRASFLDRLNHMLDYIPALAWQVPGNQHNVKGVALLLQKQGVKDTDLVYIISDIRELDGLHLPLREALAEVIDAQFGSVICCVAGKLAYYRPEAPTSGYILSKPQKSLV